MKKRFALLAAASLLGAFAFAGPGLAGSGNGSGDAYHSKFSDSVPAIRSCDTEDKGTLSTADDTNDIVTYAGPAILWPPNHKLGAESTITAAADDTNDTDWDTNDTSESVSLTTSVKSDEAPDAPGSGNTPDDVNEATPETTGVESDGQASTAYQVRAERSGQGDGRTYTIDYTATFQNADGREYVCTSVAGLDTLDALGRPIVRPLGGAFTVTVPHDMSDPAIRALRTNGH